MHSCTDSVECFGWRTTSKYWVRIRMRKSNWSFKLENKNCVCNKQNPDQKHEHPSFKPFRFCCSVCNLAKVKLHELLIISSSVYQQYWSMFAQNLKEDGRVGGGGGWVWGTKTLVPIINPWQIDICAVWITYQHLFLDCHLLYVMIMLVKLVRKVLYWLAASGQNVEPTQESIRQIVFI